ncbi:MAG TPA: 50S ribosomal protein L10 [Longimicrobiaceae bacterium]|nr:50S ribosomal protein L10 [Longimicrobiaceae bacterium]
MKRTDKDAFIGEFQQRLEGARAFYLTDFTGLSVKQITQFRARLRKQGVDYVVVKNTLAQRALQEMDLPDIAGFFRGPTGVVIGRDDPVAAAKVLTDFAREFGDRPAVKVGVVEKREYGPEAVKKLADLPPREVLLAQLAGGLNAPLGRLVGGMSEVVARFARSLDALRQQKEGAGA